MEDWRKLAADAERRQEKIPERRRGSGPLLKFISIFGFVSWIFMLAALLLIKQARPQLETFFDRWMGLQAEQAWDLTLYRYAFYLMLLVMVFAFTGLVLNAFRRRRQTDSWRLNLIFVFLMSLAGVIYYLVN